MNAHTTVTGRTLVPTLRYRNVQAAIAWLCAAFGFEKHLVVTGDDGSIRYAQLTFGEGMIMVVPVEDTAFDQLMKQPEEAGGAETQICYLYVENVAAHYDRAKASGAEILLDLDLGDSSGRGYSCRDLEGHIWNFGTYDPWRRPPGDDEDIDARSSPRRPGQIALMAGLFFLTIALGAALGISYGPAYQVVTESAAAGDPSESDALIGREQHARAAAEQAAAAARDELARERSARELAERAVKEAEARLAARTAAEQTLAQPRTPPEPAERVHTEARKNMQQAQREADAARKLLALEQKAREAAEEMAREARERIARERDAREAAERAAKEAREKVAKLRAYRYRTRQATEFTNLPWPNNTWR
jgi:uncharacterized glyoxalase superfamily protein PhnB